MKKIIALSALALMVTAFAVAQTPPALTIDY